MDTTLTPTPQRYRAFGILFFLSGATFHSPTKLHLGATNGFMYQGSQSGSVFGPPIIAAIVTQTGKWESAGWLLFSLTCISLIAVFLMRKYEKRIEDKC